MSTERTPTHYALVSRRKILSTAAVENAEARFKLVGFPSILHAEHEPDRFETVVVPCSHHVHAAFQVRGRVNWNWIRGKIEVVQ